MSREVIFAPEALRDVRKLYDDIARDGGIKRAQNYTDHIIAYCFGLSTFPKRGIRRDDLRSGLWITTYRRRVTIAYHLTEIAIVIDRILYGGRNLTAVFYDDDHD